MFRQIISTPLKSVLRNKNIAKRPFMYFSMQNEKPRSLKEPEVDKMYERDTDENAFHQVNARILENKYIGVRKNEIGAGPFPGLRTEHIKEKEKRFIRQRREVKQKATKKVVATLDYLFKMQNNGRPIEYDTYLLMRGMRHHLGHHERVADQVTRLLK